MAKNTNKAKSTANGADNSFESNDFAQPKSFLESERFWRVGQVLVLAAAIFLRFYDLWLKPFHHDEGVNGFFLLNLVRQGVYKYDPSNYHGPTLYFFAQASSYLFGLNDFAVRFVPALFGVLIVLMILNLRGFLGTAGALAAAWFVALSPGMVYISRYFIHEMHFVFFTFATAVCVVKFIERETASKTAIAAISGLLLVCLLPGTINFAGIVGGASQEMRVVALVGFFVLECGIVFLLVRSLANWNNGKPVYLLLAAASVALTFATKETAFISFGTMLIAVFCVAVWRKLLQPNDSGWREAVDLSFKNFARAFGDSQNAVVLILLCAILFAYVGALFFSSFFTFNAGISGAFEAYAFWTKTGGKDHTQNGIFAYLKWAFAIEAALILLAAFGALAAIIKAKHKFAMFAALWAFGLLAAYSIIPYKTPWLAVNFLMPMGLSAGYAINELAVSRHNLVRAAAVLLTIIGGAALAYQSVELNFVKYDDNSKPYIYAHTVRDVFALTKEIERVAAKSGKNKDAAIIVAARDYWSLPWYLRDYKGAAFYGEIYPASTAEMVIGSANEASEMEDEYAAHYAHTKTFTLRPGVELMLYVRRDLIEE